MTESDLLRARIGLLVAALEGIRDMAQLEADHGSDAWARACVAIERALDLNAKAVDVGAALI